MFGKAFKELRKSKGFTQEGIAKAIGVTRQSVQKWETDSSCPERERWGVIEQTLGVEKGWVLDNLKNTSEIDGAFSNATVDVSTSSSTIPEPSNVTPYFDPRPVILVPVISWVQAGGWEHAADPFPPGDADDWLETSATSSKYAFALSVHGDSMVPEFNPGDLIVVDPERRAENGSFVIAKNGAGEATFKKLVIDGSSVFLQPLNERYPIKDMTGVEFKIIGVVSEKRKRY